MDSEAKKIQKWADSGDRTDPENLSSPIDRDDGYTAEYSSAGSDKLFPPRQLENQILRELTGWAYDTMRQGVPNLGSRTRLCGRCQ